MNCKQPAHSVLRLTGAVCLVRYTVEFGVVREGNGIKAFGERFHSGVQYVTICVLHCLQVIAACA